MVNTIVAEKQVLTLKYSILLYMDIIKANGRYNNSIEIVVDYIEDFTLVEILD